MKERPLLDVKQIKSVARDNNLGEVYFQEKIALNTGKLFEVGYVYVNGCKELFCKRSSNKNVFFLCNEFEKLLSE